MAEKVSGPGKFAQRTDRNTSKQPVRYMSGGSYGEGQALLNTQSQANMYKKVNASAPNLKSLMEPVVPFNAPSQRPEESVLTQPDYSNMPMPARPTPRQVFEELLPYDSSGQIAEILNSGQV